MVMEETTWKRVGGEGWRRGEKAPKATIISAYVEGHVEVLAGVSAAARRDKDQATRGVVHGGQLHLPLAVARVGAHVKAG